MKINSTVNKTDTGFLTRLLDTTNFKEVAELKNRQHHEINMDIKNIVFVNY